MADGAGVALAPAIYHLDTHEGRTNALCILTWCHLILLIADLNPSAVVVSERERQV